MAIVRLSLQSQLIKQRAEKRLLFVQQSDEWAELQNMKEVSCSSNQSWARRTKERRRSRTGSRKSRGKTQVIINYSINGGSHRLWIIHYSFIFLASFFDSLRRRSFDRFIKRCLARFSDKKQNKKSFHQHRRRRIIMRILTKLKRLRNMKTEIYFSRTRTSAWLSTAARSLTKNRAKKSETISMLLRQKIKTQKPRETIL